MKQERIDWRGEIAIVKTEAILVSVEKGEKDKVY